MNPLHSTLVLLLIATVFSSNIYAITKPSKVVLIHALDSILFPIIIAKEKPDIIAPSKPILTITPPSSTTLNNVNIEIRGEVASKIVVNGKVMGSIGNSGKTIITLDTSGSEGLKSFTIILKDSANNASTALVISIKKLPDTKYDITYKGLTFYHQNKPSSKYALKQFNDSQFNTLNDTNKLLVANKLLSTLFFGYPQKELQVKIDSGNFIASLRAGLEEDKTDKEWLENYILDPDKFRQYDRWDAPQVITILSRFYAMKHLDNYFLKNWIAYILTQTIMFSPAYELESTHTPNIGNVYNRLVTFLNEEGGMRYISYIHMMSEDNWRRFRSPEDNGREMLEIFHLDMDDSHVPIAGKALQNWKLNTDSDTLEVSLNQNRQALNLFGTVIINGDDFYRELVKSDQFIKGVTSRLVHFFFPEAHTNKKDQITQTIISSHPETWQDILLQIIFSDEYLLHNQRVKSAEETFFSFSKKIHYNHRMSTFSEFKEALENMHQASMKYKLGKLKRVPLDTLSFAYYHKFIREQVLLRKSYPEDINDYTKWGRQGWDESFVDDSNYNLNEHNGIASLESFIHYLFTSTISRHPTQNEMTLFKTHMLRDKSDSDSTQVLSYTFNLIETRNDPTDQKKRREYRKRNIARIVLDYISRLNETYTFSKVK